MMAKSSLVDTKCGEQGNLTPQWFAEIVIVFYTYVPILSQLFIVITCYIDIC